MPEILHDALPLAHAGDPRLPGTMPCAPNDWLRIDATYAAQIAYRTRLLAQQPQNVLYEPDPNSPANTEVFDAALEILPNLGFSISGNTVICPDGRAVAIDRSAPLCTLGQLVQEDICVLQKQGGEHVLTGAVLCFPASWRLSEKAGRPLIAIHKPVPEYDENVARRVQRLFDGVRAGHPMWRFNKLPYADADLHQPYRKPEIPHMPFIRSERQCILRLPRTDAVVFTIHTFVVRA